MLPAGAAPRTCPLACWAKIFEGSCCWMRKGARRSRWQTAAARLLRGKSVQGQWCQSRCPTASGASADVAWARRKISVRGLVVFPSLPVGPSHFTISVSTCIPRIPIHPDCGALLKLKHAHDPVQIACRWSSSGKRPTPCLSTGRTQRSSKQDKMTALMPCLHAVPGVQLGRRGSLHHVALAEEPRCIVDVVDDPSCGDPPARNGNIRWQPRHLDK